MRFFGRKKRSDIIDFTESYKRPKKEEKKPSAEESVGGFGFLGDLASSVKSQEDDTLDMSDSQEKRKKLAIRLMEMTERIEDFSNQIYHIQQRLEVIEKRLNINKFE